MATECELMAFVAYAVEFVRSLPAQRAKAKMVRKKRGAQAAFRSAASTEKGLNYLRPHFFDEGGQKR